jgi:cytosine/adenosine deaminase-related metal-dependent hydrolase
MPYLHGLFSQLWQWLKPSRLCYSAKFFLLKAVSAKKYCAWGTARAFWKCYGGHTSGLRYALNACVGDDFVEESGMRVATGHSVFQLNLIPPLSNHFSHFEEAYAAYHNRGNGRMKVFATVHSGYLYPPNRWRGAACFNKQGYRVHTHLHETRKEVVRRSPALWEATHPAIC